MILFIYQDAYSYAGIGHIQPFQTLYMRPIIRWLFPCRIDKWGPLWGHLLGQIWSCAKSYQVVLTLEGKTWCCTLRPINLGWVAQVRVSDDLRFKPHDHHWASVEVTPPTCFNKISSKISVRRHSPACDCSPSRNLAFPTAERLRESKYFSIWTNQSNFKTKM